MVDFYDLVRLFDMTVRFNICCDRVSIYRKSEVAFRTCNQRWFHLRLVTSDALIRHPKANSDKHADRISNPIVYVRATVEGGLNDLNYAAEGARADEDRKQAKAPGEGQRKGQRHEGDEVDQLVATLRRWGRRL